MKGLCLVGYVAGAVMALGACDSMKPCHDGGPGPSLELTLTSEDWVAGEYQVELTPEEPSRRALRCTLTRTTPETGGLADCTGPGDMFGLNDIRLYYGDTDPVPAQLTVTRDGETLYDERINPPYEERFPYGEDCGATEVAELTVTLP